MQEKIWELDKSWQNNLIFYGVRSDHIDEHPSVTESLIRHILSRQMYVTREIPIARVRRTNKVTLIPYPLGTVYDTDNTNIEIAEISMNQTIIS